MFARNAFSNAAGSPPSQILRSETFGPSSMNGASSLYSTSPASERHPTDRNGVMPALATSISDPSTFGGSETRPTPAVLIRKLPRNTMADALRSMLIFANDLIDVDFIVSPYPEDTGHATAVARFQTSAGALEAQQKLNGKPNTTKDANMIVEAHSGNVVGSFERRNTIDGTAASRTQSSSASSGASGTAPPPRSRFGTSFQSNDKISPSLPTSASSINGEFPNPENSAHFQNLFSPHSPLANGINGHHRVSGKSMINDDSVDDETGELLKDPVAYAENGHNPFARRPTNSQIPISRFGNLSLSTANGSAHDMAYLNGVTSPRSKTSAHSSVSPMSPNSMSTMGPNGGAYVQNYTRSQLPPVNPADQNPPCNTLYVGNLPIGTSEDELKQVFSKQRGYKRLCFRTKQNGPMCFVEFEDVSFATKTLNELYGHLLHNSVKGGIRLSFSKNPLGVRSGQTNGLGPNAVMSPQAMAPGYGGIMAGTSFSSVSGPPPGLASPPGLVSGGGYRSPPVPTGMDSMFANPFGMPSPDYHNQIVPRQYSGGVPPTMGNGTYGIDSRIGYNEYSYGR